MRERSPAAQNGLLLHLASSVEQNGTAQTVELWIVRKGDRELRFEAQYLPNGIDLRLMEGEDFRRTKLVTDAIETIAVSDEWRHRLVAHGWKVISA